MLALKKCFSMQPMEEAEGLYERSEATKDVKVKFFTVDYLL